MGEEGEKGLVVGGERMIVGRSLFAESGGGRLLVVMDGGGMD